MSETIFVLVYKVSDCKFNLIRAFENRSLLEFYTDDRGIDFSWDVESNKEGYYAYEVIKD